METLFIILVLSGILLFGIFSCCLQMNRSLKARLFLQLYEKIHQNENFRRIERILENSESPDFALLRENEKENFEDYLRFFDSMVVTKIPDHFSKEESDLLFARPAELLNRHYFVRNHIAGNYPNLDAILTLNTQETKKLSAR